MEVSSHNSKFARGTGARNHSVLRMAIPSAAESLVYSGAPISMGELWRVWEKCRIPRRYSAVNCSNPTATKDPISTERKHTIKSSGKPR